MIVNVQLGNDSDLLIWSLHQHGRFSVHSMYVALMVSNVIPRDMQI